MNTMHSVSDTSRMRSSEAVAVCNSFSFRSWMMRVMLVVMIVVGGKVAWGETVTYTITTTSTVSISGTAPAGSSATYSSTYGTACQLTKNNSMTLTLSGYAGYKITGITLSMKSNKSSGAGNFSMVAGSTTLSSISTNPFNNVSWHGSWSASYVDVTPTMTNDNYEIKNNENVVVTIAATANSLYCQSFTITYEPILAVSYTVTYDSNGGSGNMTDSNSPYSSGSTVTVLANIFTRTGYTFTSWNTAADGSGTYYDADNTFRISANTTLYAQWTPQYYVTWHISNTTEQTGPYDYSTTIPAGDIPSASIACNGKIFVGWTTSGIVGEQNAPPVPLYSNSDLVETTIDANITYYAVFANAAAGTAPVNTLLWSETWNGAVNAPLSNYVFTGTTVYNSEVLTYEQTSTTSDTKLYNESLAGGTAYELLLAKNGGTWTISNIPTGGAKEMILTFLSNKTSFILTSSTEGITITGSGKKWTITTTGNVSNFDLTLENIGSENSRIDNVNLVIDNVLAASYSTSCITSTCPIPTSLSVSDIEQSTATISWTEGGSEEYWEYFYSNLTTIPPTNGTLTNSNSVELTGLLANTIYYWLVRAKCGEGNYSSWAVGGFFKTDNYEITVVSNDEDLGTVSLDGTTITAIPEECVGYASPAYTVVGNADVIQDDNTFEVVPSGNCTITINFERKSYSVSWNVNGTTVSTRNYCEGATIPSEDIPSPITRDCDGIKVFVGWTTSTILNETNTLSSPLYSNSTIPSVAGNSAYYAVFAELNAYNLYSGTLAEGDYIIYYDSKAMDTTVSSNRLQYEEVTPSAGIITTTSSAIVWHIAKRGIYWTIYNNAAGKYAASTGSKNQAQLLESGTDDKSLWTVSGTSAYEFVNKYNASADINDHLRENGIYGFACYSTSTGDALSLYKASYSKYSTVCAPAVFYDGNGATSGSVVDSNSPYTIGASVTVLGQGDLERPGYSFGGWNTEPDGTGDNYSVDTTFTITENVILYAQWTVSRYTVKWLANGLEIGNHTYDYGEYIDDEVPEDTEANDYACDGKVFVGWSESAFDEYDGTPTLIQKSQIEGISVTSNITYYAVFAEKIGSDNYEWILVLDASTLAVNDSIVIVASNYLEALSTTQNDNNRSAVNITKSNDKDTVSLGGTVQIIRLDTGTVDNTFGFYVGNGYLFAASSSKNYLRTQATNNANGSWEISIADSVASIVAQGTNTRNILQYNSSSSIFSCYASVQQDVSIYKKTKVSTYSNYTTFCPCNYGTITDIANGDMVWAGKNVGAEWNDKDNWVVYNNSGEPKYHLATEAPTSGNVFIKRVNDGGGCIINVKPNLTSNVTCNNLKLDGIGIDIAENKTLTINGTATFTSGIINGNVTFGSSAKVNGASTSSHVDGIVTKSGAANSTGFYFPTGSNGNLGKVEVSNDATNVSVQYFCNPAGFGTNDLPRWWNAADMSGENPFNHVSNVEYWRISSNEAITANFVAVASAGMQHFNSETAEEDKIPTNIQMAFYDNNRWTNVGGTASIDGNTLTINGAEIPASATRGISGNYTTFGSKSKNTVLPIELLSFTANCNGKSSLIEWTTATEKNNDFFVLERSNDAINFKEIARIVGAGNSIEPISYAYTDYGARSGDNYYRLVQVDYDGTSTASEIIVANCPAETSGEPDVLAFPNPFDDNLTLHFENFGNVQATVEVYDMLGRMVQTQKVNCSQNDYEVVLRLAGLSEGTYNVRISTKEFVLNKKVVKQ